MNDQNKYLIIGGSTKCGTTSVFKYFEFHPEICPCTMKESRYFLDDDYQLVAKKRDKLKYRNFSELFTGCKSGAVRLEATPDYLYSAAAAERIKSELINCKLIFILRDPAERLGSWYRFALLNGLIPPVTSFSDYILQQQNNPANAPQHLKSLEQGRYAEYLEKYIQAFGKENIHICFYENLMADPAKFCGEICAFAGIGEGYFTNFDFKIYNKSVPVKSVNAHRLFRKFKRTVRPLTKMLPLSMRKKLKLAGYNLEQAYSSANTGEAGVNDTLTPGMKVFLKDYYAAYNRKLNEIAGVHHPW